MFPGLPFGTENEDLDVVSTGEVANIEVTTGGSKIAKVYT